jgi:hypothetical protein
VGPAEIADWADQDDAYAEPRLGFGLLAGQRCAGKTGRTSHKMATGDVHEALPEKRFELSKFNAESIFKPSGITWRLGKCDQTKHFQAKWYHLAARKMR